MRRRPEQVEVPTDQSLVLRASSMRVGTSHEKANQLDPTTTSGASASLSTVSTVGPRLSLDRFLELDHVLVAPGGTPGGSSTSSSPNVDWSAGSC
ncbi:MAG: hypothetical protein IT379_37840 [Deltaproteobacteria bacterium]|nr:hypothetical protein [Deltaproteobacteria bacterium]